MTDAEAVAELRMLLAERDAEIAELKERLDAAWPKTWAGAKSRASMMEILADKLRRKGAG